MSVPRRQWSPPPKASSKPASREGYYLIHLNAAGAILWQAIFIEGYVTIGIDHFFRIAARSMITKSNLLALVMLQVALLAPASAVDRKPDECGLASIYSSTSEETASGEDTLAENFTAAHRTLPFGALVHVNNQKNGRSTVVRITDRGPFVAGRIIDVSQTTARDLGITGLTPVCLNIIWIPEQRQVRGN
jgi:peptidoglycan lytic transglycosylase